MKTATCIGILLAWAVPAQAVTFYTNPAVLGSPSAEADFITKQSEGVRPVFLNRIVNTGSNPGKYTNSGAVKENAEGTSPFTVIFNFTDGKAFTATISWNLTGTGYQMQAYPKSAMLLQGAPLANGSIPYALYNPSPSENLKSLGSFTARVNANADRNIVQVSFFGLPTSGSPPGSSATTSSNLGSSVRHQLCLLLMARWCR
jgi:hypothetical protein